MEDFKVKKYGALCGKQGSCSYYKAFKYSKGGKSKIIGLGQFFFMKIFRDVPICIGELQLVWEDKNTSQDLASVRLYFLPECTPDGRQTLHGEDEVLAYSEKIVLKLDDLGSLLVQNVSWSDGRQAFVESKLLAHEEHEELAEAFKLNCFGLNTDDIDVENRDSDDPSDTTPDIVIMNFARYCRYRSVLKRLEKCEDKWLRHAIITAIGGFTAGKANNRVYFCRDTFEHPDLDDFELRCDHLAPSMKGRIKKAKHRSKTESPKLDAKEDSNDSSEESNSTSSASSQNDNIRTGARATPLRNGFRIDKTNVSKDEQAFLIDLHKYMKSRNTPIGRIPSLGFKQIDLYQFHQLAEEIGGYEQITVKRLWKNIYDELGGSPGSTSAATYTRRHYEKLLLPYERHKRMQRGMKGIREKKHKHDGEPTTYFSRSDHFASRVSDGAHVKDEAKIKDEDLTNEANHINGGNVTQTTNKENVNMKERTFIIRQEIEKMKMRKDAQKVKDTGTDSEKEKSGESPWKVKVGEKIRKPSGGQKTVRELLDQNGKEVELEENGSMEKLSSQDRRPDNGHIKEESQRTDHYSQPEKNNIDYRYLGDSKFALPGYNLDSNLRSQPHISPLSPPRPMLYPQFIPMAPHFRGVAPVHMPFMLPQFGLQALGNPSMHPSLLSPTSPKESKPETSFNSLLTDVKNSMDKSAIYSNNLKSKQPGSVPPPSHHTQPPKGPITSAQVDESKNRPIVAAHSNSVKRQYPYMESDRNLPGYGHVKRESSKNSDIDLKRQKSMGASDSSAIQSGSGQYDSPALDLSMKTLRAQEERQLRGESLLFNTSFNKDGSKSHHHHPKSMFEAPQDLSLKSPSLSRPSDLPSNLSSNSSHRSVPLNVPHPRSTHDLKSPSLSKSENHKRDGLESKHEKSDASLKFPPGGLIPSIGGLPVDMGSLVHPAFPFLPGVFPTPMQLQQMIQGQVAAGMPRLFRPEMIPSQLMFPPALGSFPPGMFTSVAPTVAKTSTSTSLSKR